MLPCTRVHRFHTILDPENRPLPPPHYPLPGISQIDFRPGRSLIARPPLLIRATARSWNQIRRWRFSTGEFRQTRFRGTGRFCLSIFRFSIRKFRGTIFFFSIDYIFSETFLSYYWTRKVIFNIHGVLLQILRDCTEDDRVINK